VVGYSSPPIFASLTGIPFGFRYPLCWILRYYPDVASPRSVFEVCFWSAIWIIYRRLVRRRRVLHSVHFFIQLPPHWYLWTLCPVFPLHAIQCPHSHVKNGIHRNFSPTDRRLFIIPEPGGDLSAPSQHLEVSKNPFSLAFMEFHFFHSEITTCTLFSPVEAFPFSPPCIGPPICMVYRPLRCFPTHPRPTGPSDF